MARFRCFGLFVLLLGVIGCDEGVSDGPSHTVTDSAGIQIVESRAPAWGRGDGWIDPEPLLRIGREEDGPYLFDYVSSVRFLDDGRIAMTDGGAREIRIFDAEGRHLQTLGGQGRGPGEFSQLSGLHVHGPDSVIVFDAVQRRSSVFSLSSGGVRSFRNPDGNWAFFGRIGDGSYVAFDPGGAMHRGLPVGLQWVESELLAMDPADGAGRIVTRLPGRRQFIGRSGEAETVIPEFYFLQAAGDDGVYSSKGERWEIQLIDPSGAVKRILRRPVEPRPLTPDLVHQYIEGRLEEVRRTRGEDRIPWYRDQYENAHLGETIPLFTVGFVDTDQRLWVGLSEWPDQMWTTNTWAVFSPEGFLLGEVGTPDGFLPRDAMGDRVLGVWSDEFDVHHIQVHRLAGG